MLRTLGGRPGRRHRPLVQWAGPGAVPILPGDRHGRRAGWAMSLLIVLAALAFLMVVAYAATA
jgi:hypothetical protein